MQRTPPRKNRNIAMEIHNPKLITFTDHFLSAENLYEKAGIISMCYILYC
jgi:hypothetical protein